MFYAKEPLKHLMQLYGSIVQMLFLIFFWLDKQQTLTHQRKEKHDI